ncbi:hypothetical protein Q9L58_002385 [Maublancomyces gigas]|uniref:Uncharacterized protein n=1 Tax=Discina gigas TaxID=1032678 RepID=A0ABR3GS32_9PEZI
MSTVIDNSIINPDPAPLHGFPIDNPDPASAIDNPPHVSTAADSPNFSPPPARRTVLNDPRPKSKMTPHSELSPPPSPRSETKHPRAPKSTSEFASHLSSIPLFASVSDAFFSHSPRALSSALGAAQNLTQACVPAGLLNRADKLADALLTQVEYSFPAVKTPTAEVTARPKQLYERVVTQPITSVRTATQIYTEAGKQRVTETREGLVDAYKRYVEPTIGEYTNGPVGRINDRFEGAVETGMPKSYREAVVESEEASREGSDKIELYRSVRLARNALERGRVRFWVPMQNAAWRTSEDVKEGGETTKNEVRGAPGRVRDGVAYFRQVVDEEVRRERGGEGRGVGVWGMGKVTYRVCEKCAGEVVGAGLLVAAKSTGVLLGVWGLGKGKVSKVKVKTG